MKFIINGKFLTQKLTGVQRFSIELVRALDNLVDNNEVEVLIPANSEMIDLNLKNIKIIIYGCLKGILWEQICLPHYIYKNNAIGINLGNVAPLIKPDIICIHDMNAIINSKWFDRKYVFWCKLQYLNAKHRAKLILTVSNFSKKELIKYLNMNPKKIFVISEGWDQINRIEADKTALKKYQLCDKNFFLSIFQMMPSKNFKWIIEVAKNYPDFIFVVSGWSNRKVNLQNEFYKDIKNIKNIKLINYVTDGEMKMLLLNCKAFLFPSLYEGFGLPPLEAFAVNTRVIVSDIEVMHEIFGNTVEYVNTKEYKFNFKDQNLISNSLKSNILKKYTWNNAAKQLKSIFMEYKSEK